MKRGALTLFGVCLSLQAMTAIADPSVVRQYSDWVVFTENVGGEKMCYAARIGRSDWTLFGVGREAFAQDSDDARLVRQLKRGSELRVEATSARNTRVTYHFSLAGSSAAIDRAAAVCR